MRTPARRTAPARRPPSAAAITTRALAAVAGGYALAALVAAACAAWLPRWLSMGRADATLTGMLVSFAIYAGTVLWAFAARSATRAWMGVALAAAPPALLLAPLLWPAP